MYLLQIEATDNDLYEIRKQDLDLDENADKIERNEKGQITRSPKNGLQAETRSSKFGLQVEKASNGDSLQSNQKSKLYTSEVQNLGTNKNNNKQTEEEEYHINNPIFLQLKNSKIFTKQEIEQIINQLDECVTEEMISDQLNVMAMQTKLLSPKKYFLNGIRKTIDFYEFKAEMMLNKKAN